MGAVYTVEKFCLNMSRTAPSKVLTMINSFLSLAGVCIN